MSTEDPTGHMSAEQKDQMFKWVEEARSREWEDFRIAQANDQDAVVQPPGPWWEKCSDPVAARAFVAEFLPNLLAGGAA